MARYFYADDDNKILSNILDAIGDRNERKYCKEHKKSRIVLSDIRINQTQEQILAKNLE